LIHRIYPDAQFPAEANAYAARLAAKSASALMLSKRLLDNMDSTSFEAALTAGVDTNVLARTTEDCRRGVERFLKKR
jgi:methylglutaconyl-CoA hydratase